MQTMGPAKIALMVMTNGRKDMIEPTLASAQKNLLWEFRDRFIVNDDPDPAYHQWLVDRFGGNFEVHSTTESLGFCGNVQRGWSLLAEDLDFVFHLEDDFTFNEVIHVSKMIDILTLRPNLAQISLLRQPVSPAEKQAGGIIQKINANSFVEHREEGLVWVEHHQYFTTNPSLYPRHIANLGYPQEDCCEGKFGWKIRDMGLDSGILGRKWQSPKVEHIGIKRGDWKWI